MNAERERVPTDTLTIPLFRCDKRACTLAKASCARMWEQAQLQRPEPWQSLWSCRYCPVGAVNAGRPAAEAAALGGSDTLRAICPRCLRLAARLINGRFCVSCFNRHREAQKGRNAKGGVPRLTAVLHAEVLAVMDGGNIRRETFDSVIGPVEAMVLAAKRARGPITFGRPPTALVEVAA